MQLPGGERVPFLFTVKNLVAQSDSGSSIDAATKFSGNFKVGPRIETIGYQGS